jgi:hypothetical protein
VTTGAESFGRKSAVHTIRLPAPAGNTWTAPL